MGTGPYAIEPDRQLVPLTVLLTLFGFVSVVPHRYIAFPGISFEWIALIPSMLVVTRFSFWVSVFAQAELASCRTRFYFPRSRCLWFWLWERWPR